MANHGGAAQSREQWGFLPFRNHAALARSIYSPTLRAHTHTAMSAATLNAPGLHAEPQKRGSISAPAHIRKENKNRQRKGSRNQHIEEQTHVEGAFVWVDSNYRLRDHQPPISVSNTTKLFPTEHNMPVRQQSCVCCYCLDQSGRQTHQVEAMVTLLSGCRVGPSYCFWW